MTNEAEHPRGTALATRTLTPAAWEMIRAVAPDMAAAKYYAEVYSAAQAAAILLTGYELGLSLSASFQFVHVIGGKTSLSPAGALAILRRSGLLESIALQETPEGCTVTMTRRGGETYSVTFTLEDARRAGLLPLEVRPYDDKRRGGWEKYPANMCRWRAIGYCADYLFGDVLGGLHRTEEYGGAVDERGEVVVDAAFTPVPAVPAAAPGPTAPVADGTVTLDELIAAHGADAVLAAAGGQLPASGEGTAQAAAALAIDLLVHHPHDPNVTEDLAAVHDYPAVNGPAPSSPALEKLIVELSGASDLMLSTRARAAADIARLLRARMLAPTPEGAAL